MKTNLFDILKQLDRRLGGQIDYGIKSDVNAISSAVYDILTYLIEKEENENRPD